MAGVHLAALNTYRTVYPRVALPVTFLALWILAQAVPRAKERHDLHVEDNFLIFAANDLAKVTLSLIMQTVAFCGALPTCNGDPGRCSETMSSRLPRITTVSLTLGSMRSIVLFFVASLVYALRAYINLMIREFVDHFTLYLTFPVTLLYILFILLITRWRVFSSAFWHGCALQFAGFFITREALVVSVSPDYDLLVVFALSNSTWILLVDLIYGLHRSSSFHVINIAIFAQSSIVHLLLFLSRPPHSVSQSFYNCLASAFQVLPKIEAARDIVMMFIIEQYGALNQGILISLASTFLITIDTWEFVEAPSSAFLGCFIAVLGVGVFVLYQGQSTEQQHDIFISVRRYFSVATISLAALGYIVIVVSQILGRNSSDSPSMRRPFLGLSKSHSECRVPESSTLIHAQTIANYTHFSNVLLIVFFSHARYDANLDFHKEVYADYFPNIVYIGPASREDRGFAHSYDVHVDSFQSDEDLSNPLFYRMSGRMAHHMLYTALREYGCYGGYLWVPFDTLLNIPRLQQFNQNLFWYHSPWGQPVPNPALGNITGPELNSNRHAPPAMISPDISINLTETWRGWGPDWWWGDPHVGVSVCMDAFIKVPKDMRAHLAERMNGQTRLIGGSADTLYIPGRYRNTFMDILALFLDTNCFLEIATPTTVHLVVPPGDTIQFVDHWWIYQPPFNASFVRQKWAEGYEVDTFHTFHWGERGEDGVWRGNHGHVADVRHLLRESAIRQGLNDVFPVNVDSDVGPLNS